MNYYIPKLLHKGLIVSNNNNGKSFYDTHECFKKNRERIMNLINDLATELYENTYATHNPEETLNNVLKTFVDLVYVKLT